MTPIEVNDAQIAEWRRTNHPYKVIAAEIAEWALKQPRGTELPGNDYFAGDLDIVASASTWKRAKALLSAVGVLYANDGPYLVSIVPRPVPRQVRAVEATVADKDEIDEYIESLGITEESAAQQREEASVGCQHANMKTDGISTWCPDCTLSDFS